MTTPRPPKNTGNAPFYSTYLPSTVQAGHCLSILDPIPQTVALAADAYKRDAWPLWLDVLHATGIHLDNLSFKQDRQRARTTALVRMKHRKVTHLIVFHAENLIPKYAIELHRLAADTNTVLILVVSEETDGTIVGLIRSLGGSHVSWLEVTEMLPQLPAQNSNNPPQPARQQPHAFPNEVPLVEFPLFRWYARELLPPDEFAVVEETYCRVFRDFRQTPPPTEQAARDMLKRHLGEGRNGAELMTMAAAAQAACLINGQLLRIASDRLVEFGDSGRSHRLTHDDIENLWQFCDTSVAAMVILHDAGADDQTMDALTLRTAKTALSTVINHPLLPNAQSLLDAHINYREMQGAQPNDPFIALRVRGVSDVLSKVARVHGIPIDPVVGRHKTKPDRWSHILGTKMEELTCRPSESTLTENCFALDGTSTD